MFFNNKNFKYLWMGRFFSNFGDSLYGLPISWYLYTITDNNFWIGLLNACIYVPSIISVLFGSLFDTYSKKFILILLEVGQLVSVLLLIISLLNKQNNPLIICFLIFFASLFGVNTYTIQDSFIPELVLDKDLEKAQSSLSVVYRAADFLFNSIAGFLVNIFNLVTLLFFSIANFMLSILLFKKINYTVTNKVKRTEKNTLLTGFSLFFKQKKIVLLTIGGTIANFFFSGLGIYIIVLSDDLGGPLYLGLLTATMAAGSLIGATFFSQIIFKKNILGVKLYQGTILFGLFMVLTSIFVYSKIVFVFLFLSHIFLGLTHTVIGPIIQKSFENDDLGKIFTIKSAIEVSIMPIGSIFFGSLSNFLPLNIFCIIFGGAYIIIGIMYYFNTELRYSK